MEHRVTTREKARRGRGSDVPSVFPRNRHFSMCTSWLLRFFSFLFGYMSTFVFDVVAPSAATSFPMSGDARASALRSPFYGGALLVG